MPDQVATDLDLVDISERAAGYLGAYVHIPFCAAVCPYCDFAVVAGRDDLQSRYLAALIVEIDKGPERGPIDAVFVGGGTPSRVGGLDTVLAALERRHGLAQGAEITLEANPEDWTDHKAASLVQAGFTRVSFGAQSFDEDVLRALGRRHDPAQIEDAVAGARAAGFTSVSLDLIFGSPSESDSSWAGTVERAVALDPDHVSTYALTVERGTELSRLVAAGAPAPDPDTQASRYEMASSTLAAAGYRRYEVSNYSRPGHECRYNLTAWAQGEYLAAGMGAHGHLDGVRFRNRRRLEAYLDAIESGRSPRAGSELVSMDALEERVILGLRRAAGVSLDAAIEEFLDAPQGDRLLAAGVISARDGRLVVQRPLLTDEVCASFLAFRS